MNRLWDLFVGRRESATPHNWALVAILLLSGAFIAYTGSVVASAQKAGATSVWDGVYTDAQAARGKKLYSVSCQDCHMQDLLGDTADIPALAGDMFLDAWMNMSLDDLFKRMQSTMPQDSPSSLPTQSYVDIVSYVLQVNKFPAGDVELKRDAAAMGAIKITKTK